MSDGNVVDVVKTSKKNIMEARFVESKSFMETKTTRGKLNISFGQFWHQRAHNFTLCLYSVFFGQQNISSL